MNVFDVVHTAIQTLGFDVIFNIYFDWPYVFFNFLKTSYLYGLSEGKEDTCTTLEKMRWIQRELRKEVNWMLINFFYAIIYWFLIFFFFLFI